MSDLGYYKNAQGVVVPALGGNIPAGMQATDISGNPVGAGGSSAPAAGAGSAAPKDPAMPQMSPYYSMINSSTNNLEDAFKVNPNTTLTGNFNTDQGNAANALNSLSSYANSAGPSPQAQALLQSQTLNENQGAGNITDQGRGALAANLSDVAASGGLGSGAAERIATAGDRNTQTGLQQNNMAGQQARATIGANDASQKLGVLQALPGQETALGSANLAAADQDLSAQKFNVGTAQTQYLGQNAYNANQFNNAMSGYAANQQSNAIANSGKK